MAVRVIAPDKQFSDKISKFLTWHVRRGGFFHTLHLNSEGEQVLNTLGDGVDITMTENILIVVQHIPREEPEDASSD